MSGDGAQESLLVIAILTPRRDGATSTFREYETRAALIMARHGGRIERTVVEEPGEPGTVPREVHLIRFPDRNAFDRYRADPDLAALAAMRLASIAHTELLFGREGPDYTVASPMIG